MYLCSIFILEISKEKKSFDINNFYNCDDVHLWHVFNLNTTHWLRAVMHALSTHFVGSNYHSIKEMFLQDVIWSSSIYFSSWGSWTFSCGRRTSGLCTRRLTGSLEGRTRASKWPTSPNTHHFSHQPKKDPKPSNAKAWLTPRTLKIMICYEKSQLR